MQSQQIKEPVLPTKVVTDVDEEDDAIPQPADPLQEETEKLASARSVAASKKKKAAEARAKKQQQEEYDNAMKQETARMESQRKLEAERHKRHMEAEKMRMEQAKVHAKATRVAAESKAAREVQDITEDDTPQRREDCMRKVMLMREKLGVPGTNRRITIETPLHMLLTELEVCNTQLNLERAESMPKQLFLEASRAIEVAAMPFYDFNGTTAKFEGVLEAGERAQPGTFEWQLNRAMQQCSINYSHLFAMRPEFFLIGTFVKMAQAQNRENTSRSFEHASEPLPDDLQEQMNSFFQKQ